jgi:DnaD/phage-associated family protein
MEPLDFITLTPQETGKLLSAGSGDAALVYLYMKSTGDYRLQKAQGVLNLPAQTLGWAESLLKQLGLLDIQPTGARYSTDKAPAYTGEAVTAFAAQDPTFSLLQGEVSRRLGRVLTSEELKTLLAIRDYLKLPPEVVSLALTYCLQRNEAYNRAHGANRTVTMRALERVCYSWANQGIVTLDRASAYISQNLQRMTPEAQVKKLLHLDRPLVPAEQNYITAWLEMGFEPAAIGAAYEKTVLNKGSLVWPYMNKILLNWHEKNLHTAAQVQQEPRSGTKKPQQDQSGYTSGGYTFGESDLNAIANLQKLRDSMKEG